MWQVKKKRECYVLFIVCESLCVCVLFEVYRSKESGEGRETRVIWDLLISKKINIFYSLDCSIYMYVYKFNLRERERGEGVAVAVAVAGVESNREVYTNRHLRRKKKKTFFLGLFTQAGSCRMDDHII